MGFRTSQIAPFTKTLPDSSAVGFGVFETGCYLWGIFKKSSYNWARFKKNVNWVRAAVIFVTAALLALVGGAVLREMVRMGLPLLNRLIFSVWHFTKMYLVMTPIKGNRYGFQSWMWYVSSKTYGLFSWAKKYAFK
jgi:hypothetical protein